MTEKSLTHEVLLALSGSGLFIKRGSQCLINPGKAAHLNLEGCERMPYSIRAARLEDLPILIEIEHSCWPEHLQASEGEIMLRLRNFPEGQLVIETEGLIAGVIYSQRIQDPSLLKGRTFRDVCCLHTYYGVYLHLLAVNVRETLQDRGLGNDLLHFMLYYARYLEGVSSVIAVTLCKGYGAYPHLSMGEYIKLRNNRGRLVDPILNFHEEHGARIDCVIERYRPEDIENLGSGVLVVYDIEKTVHKRSQSPISKGLETKESDVIKLISSLSQRSDADIDQPLMEMGFDSLRLMELCILLNDSLGTKIEPSLFFRHNTPRAIARYLSENSSYHSSASEDTARPLTVSPTYPTYKKSSAHTEDTSVANGDSAIAVIGAACRFPGSINNIADLSRALRDGADVITNLPADRWKGSSLSEIKQYKGGFLRDISLFDADFFRLSPREAEFMDPQQRILLEVTDEAIEDAGISPSTLKGTNTGVFVGAFLNDYQGMLLRALAPLDYNIYYATGTSLSVLAGRVSYFYGLQGPAMTVDTACSSSLMAVHLACQSLKSGESSIALASGVNLILAPELSIAFSKAGMLSPSGACKTFDAGADGYVRSEGCAVLVLKRLRDALMDRDRIIAVITGSSCNQDGASNGLTAPNGVAQESVIRQALSKSGLTPDDIGYIETHGTGTSLGDPVEFNALRSVFSTTKRRNNPLVLGSIKATLGHTEAVAGIAGILKVITIFKERLIPRQIHLHRINTGIDLDSIPAVIPLNDMALNNPHLSAGVSSFGFSGTNVHVIVESAPEELERARLPEMPMHLLCLSARDNNALRELLTAYDRHLRANNDQSIEDICYTAATGRRHFTNRICLRGRDRQEMRESLRAAIGRFDKEEGEGVRGGEREDIVFLYTGQGSQYAGMGRELYERGGVFREAMDSCEEIYRREMGESLLDKIYGAKDEGLMNETRYAQPCIYAIGYGLTEQWRYWGIEPDVVMGHSVGEYVAACAAGVFSLEEGMRLIARRGEMMGRIAEAGAMAAIFGEEEYVRGKVERYGGEVSIAAVNGEELIVVSGVREKVEEIEREVDGEGKRVVRLRVSTGFHSRLMDEVLDELEAEAERVRYGEMRLPIVSNVSGRYIGDEIKGGRYWRRHSREAVQFKRGVEYLMREGKRVYVEVGADSVLSGMGRRVAGGSGEWMSSLQRVRGYM